MHTRRVTWAVATGFAVLAAGLYPPAAPAAETRGDGPTVIERRVIGYSVRDRPIRAYRLGERDARWTVVAIGAMHGDERKSNRPLEHLRDHQPVSGVNLWVVPILNPDGWHRGIRKNARGVDLNRNFPVKWRDLDGPYESGPRPKSEPETRAIMRFLGNVRPDRMISLHQPLFKVDAKSSKNPRFSRRVARNMRIPIGNVDCGGVCHGTMTQWFNKRTRGASITVELAAHPSEHYVTKVGPNGLLRAVYGER